MKFSVLIAIVGSSATGAVYGEGAWLPLGLLAALWAIPVIVVMPIPRLRATHWVGVLFLPVALVGSTVEFAENTASSTRGLIFLWTPLVGVPLLTVVLATDLAVRARREHADNVRQREDVPL